MPALTPADSVFFEPFNMDIPEEKLENMVPNPIAPRSGDIYPTRIKGSSQRIRELNEECDRIMQRIDRSFLAY